MSPTLALMVSGENARAPLLPTSTRMVAALMVGASAREATTRFLVYIVETTR